MKYELNTPYEFEVKNVVENDGSLYFNVEISGQLFPVKAYPEQLQVDIPSTVSCRIMLDKNKNAYLVQNEAFFYPYIYKPKHRYIFEVIDIKDSYVVLMDKHGLLHSMTKDDNRFSINEIIVRSVDIVNDGNSKAHLIFNNSDTDIEKSQEAPVEFHEIPNKAQALPKPSTIFVEDSQLKANQIESEKKQIKEATSSTSPESVSTMLLAKDWNGLILYFDSNLSGGQIPIIQKEISSCIEDITSPSLYWSVIRFLLHYDAHMFLATVANSHNDKITNITRINSETINAIIDDAFSPSDKAKHAIKLIKPLRELLTPLQKKYIQDKCKNLSDDESFYDLFKLLNFTPDKAINFLLEQKENVAAAYTIYKFYLDGKNGNHITENSIIPAFRPSVIARHCRMMSASQSFAFQVSSNLITRRILERRGSCRPEILDEVSKNGLEGFKSIIARKIHQIESKKIISSFSVGDELKGLKFIREIDNYYLLVEPKTGSHALLVKEYTVKKPNNKNLSNAVIIKVMPHFGKTMFIVSQKNVDPGYSMPPLVNPHTHLELGFTEINGQWYPDVRKYSKLIRLIIVPKQQSIDYKSKYNAEVISQKDFFTYYVRLIKQKA